ncbi:hypothetical protein [Nocardiopsis sp. MG754419]|uniref:hypothetical protein n=1 Tax=Nocardiopsis sp. MG754419 TaxID=2259865 RepID=UPI001BA635F9|nr:hypothetical protein [Nocardiopsis sp. MG754419]MBR8740243.1 hypothetical protein [Nocardiopsis sp. MG754419]
MPTREHEIPLRLVQNQPALAPVLLESLGLEVPTHTEALNTSSVLTNCDPKEFNGDGAVVLRDGTENVMAVVVERQHGHDQAKRRSWPAYLVTLHVRLKCPTMLLVLCPTDTVAAWCARPIRTGHPGFDLEPLTIGPGRMPRITGEDQARALPELAVLSARAHGDDDPETLRTVVEALNSTAPENRTFYYDYLLAGLNEAARKEMETLMAVETYEWQSDFARKYVGIGREEGRTLEAAKNVISVLEARGFDLSATTRERITSCADLATLERWIPGAVRVERPEDLFD